MSLNLLKHLNGSSTGGLKAFIQKYEGKGEPRICWYPSAGEDFRALMYLHPAFNKVSPAAKQDPPPPDIFLYSDYSIFKTSALLESKVIYTDKRTFVTVGAMEELPKIGTSLHSEIVIFPEENTLTGRALFLTINIESNKYGRISAPVVYVFAENEAFCGERLIPLNARLSHIIHVRYGGGFGGGYTSGIWMLNVLKRLHCEMFISDGHYHKQRGDTKAIKLYPVLGETDCKANLEVIRSVESMSWSGHGDVTWNLVS